jgi:ATP phosphoribosyltransferase
VEKLANKRIATAYPGLVQNYLDKAKIQAQVVKLDGAVETSVRLGVADVIADVVSTGGTLRQAGLAIFGEPILQSEAIVIERAAASSDVRVDTLKRRLQGVVIAKQYVLVDYDVEDKFLEEACRLTPGIESPTVSALAKPGWSAVRSMVPKSEINRIMDSLWGVGARGI